MSLINREELLEFGNKKCIKTAVGNWDELDNKAKAAVLRYAVYLKKVIVNLDEADAIEAREVVKRFDWAITYANGAGAYFTGMRNALRWCKSVVDGNAPECETVPDSVEVVRCGECQHMTNELGLRYCNVWERINGMGDEGFCNYGERKTE